MVNFKDFPWKNMGNLLLHLSLLVGWSLGKLGNIHTWNPNGTPWLFLVGFWGLFFWGLTQPSKTEAPLGLQVYIFDIYRMCVCVSPSSFFPYSWALSDGELFKSCVCSFFSGKKKQDPKTIKMEKDLQRIWRIISFSKWLITPIYKTWSFVIRWLVPRCFTGSARCHKK